MPKGLITSLLLKLTLDFWYFTALALILKAVLIRFTIVDRWLKSFFICLTGTFIFYIVSCLAGIVFSSAGFYIIPMIMFIFGTILELVFVRQAFKFSMKRSMLAIVIGNASLFFLLFMQMM